MPNKEIEQYFHCCLNPDDYQKFKDSGQIIFSDKYIVQHVDHWTGQPLIPEKIMSSPSFYPGVRVFYPANSSTEKTARVENRKLFDAVDSNCNTCRHLQRIKHDKHPLGTLFGKCLKKDKELKFHPEDCQYSNNKDCWEGR